MAVTTNYNWTTPDDVDLVKDGAAAIRTLGSSADTTVKALNPGTTAGDIDYYTTSTAKARIAIGTAGQLLAVNSGATAPEWVTPASASPASASARVETEQSTTSSSFTDLATSGPAVTLTTGTKVLVILTAEMLNSSAVESNIASFAISGATTVAAGTIDWYVRSMIGTANERERFSAATRYASLTAGSNTFTMKYRRTGGTASFGQREIIVIDLGS